MRRASIVLTAMIAMIACGAPLISASDDVLFLRTAGGIEALSAATGEVELRLSGAVASSDFDVVAAAQPAPGATIVRRLSAEGRQLTRVSVPGELQVRVVSADGELIALTAPREAGAAPYLPAARERSRIVVLHPSRGEMEFDLEGNFEPEAFDLKGRELFMIEYIPALRPERYRVRRLLLGTGRVAPIGRLKSAAPDQMQGTGRTQTYSPSGDELYTLYTQQTQSGHDTGLGHPGGHAFVHLLNLRGSWAHCIDLPHVFGSGDATASALATSPDGRLLYVVDWTNGAVAVVLPGRVRVLDDIELSLGSADENTFAQANDRHLFLGGNSSVVVLDRSSLQIVDRWTLDDEVTGVRLSPDGDRLYVSMADETTAFNTAGGESLGTLETPRASVIEHVGRT